MSGARCPWALRSKVEMKYHDEEWGIPTFEESYIFEMLILEGKQAGLSWSTIINKRASLRVAFDNFNPYKIATYDESKIKELMLNEGIIRHELKIRAVIHNAQIYLTILASNRLLSDILWTYVDYKPIINKYKESKEVPSQTELSKTISEDLKKIGFKFVGPTTTYALMQAIGMVNDHLITCPFHSHMT